MRILSLFVIFSILFTFQNCEKHPSSVTYHGNGDEFSQQSYEEIPKLPFQAKFIRSPDDYTRKIGQTVAMTAEIQSEYHRVAQYNWYHNGKLVAEDAGNKYEIRFLDFDNSGEYTVKAKIGDDVITSEAGTLTIVDAQGNDRQGRFVTTINSNGGVSNYNWTVTPFLKCSVSCGEGTQIRSISCLSKLEGTTVNDRNCTGPRPLETSECMGTQCGSRHEFTEYGTIDEPVN